MKHIERLRYWNACSEGVEWASKYPDLEQAWKACDREDWMIWLLGASLDLPEKRVMVAIACEVVRASFGPHIDSERVKAIEIAEAWLKDPTEERRRAAYDFQLDNDDPEVDAAEAAVWVAGSICREDALDWMQDAVAYANVDGEVACDIIRKHVPIPPSLD